MAKKIENTVILLMHCPDNKGIVAQVTGFINDNNGNINPRYFRFCNRNR